MSTADPDAARLAALHATCFTTPRPWTSAEFTALLADPLAMLCQGWCQDRLAGFALLRIAADEAELLTLAVAPEFRRRGLARALLAQSCARARRAGARALFLEVAETNSAALALYASGGFAERGRRCGYYRAADGAAMDAVIMCRSPC